MFIFPPLNSWSPTRHTARSRVCSHTHTTLSPVCIPHVLPNSCVTDVSKFDDCNWKWPKRTRQRDETKSISVWFVSMYWKDIELTHHIQRLHKIFARFAIAHYFHHLCRKIATRFAFSIYGGQVSYTSFVFRNSCALLPAIVSVWCELDFLISVCIHVWFFDHKILNTLTTLLNGMIVAWNYVCTRCLHMLKTQLHFSANLCAIVYY